MGCGQQLFAQILKILVLAQNGPLNEDFDEVTIPYCIEIQRAPNETSPAPRFFFCKTHYFAFVLYLSSEKSSKNYPKTESGRPKNRLQKRVRFHHRFFRVWASIWAPLGLPKWSQVGPKSEISQRVPPRLSQLKLNVFQKLSLEGSGVDFGASGA